PLPFGIPFSLVNCPKMRFSSLSTVAVLPLLAVAAPQRSTSPPNFVPGPDGKYELKAEGIRAKVVLSEIVNLYDCHRLIQTSSRHTQHQSQTSGSKTRTASSEI